ncbi:component of the spindle assembly checkpoint dma1 [Malassezia pachydermatis]|uniref:Component of the spindle assembly checkpoint dma1 n=1 Tax=Malassezia pachydermatis TaxID=77020 RepID=A0A0M9VQ80_9BASI|nr:component of the spindle assembly checkpoint dma1 [Malassezia pachydermatis]KOS15223.1 component of the spindle assembly checkpoint dma1 [Malassezia pachydermatis]
MSSPSQTAQTLAPRSSSVDTAGTARLPPSSADYVPDTSAKKHKIRLAPHMDATRSLVFFPTDLELIEGGPSIQIGRFSDRYYENSISEMQADLAADRSSTNGPPSSSEVREMMAQASPHRQPVVLGHRKRCVAFQSKVVSRLHAELWADVHGKIYIRDTRSSSGTFLNRLRLAPAGILSRTYELQDGDLVQLGVDYQGGSQDVYRAIKIRMEIDREPKQQSRDYGEKMLRQFQSTKAQPGAPSGTAAPVGQGLDECCICLLKIRVFQPLFIAPCSHIFHYKCIRPLISLHYPGFSCPLCRTFADLEADIADDSEEEKANENGDGDDDDHDEGADNFNDVNEGPAPFSEAVVNDEGRQDEDHVEEPLESPTSSSEVITSSEYDDESSDALLSPDQESQEEPSSASPSSSVSLSPDEAQEEGTYSTP